MDFKKILFKTNEIDVERALPDAVFLFNPEKSFKNSPT